MSPPEHPVPAADWADLAIQIARLDERSRGLERQLSELSQHVQRLDNRLWWIMALIVGQIIVPLVARRWGL